MPVWLDETTFLGISAWDWIKFFLITVLSYIVIKLVLSFLIEKLTIFSKKSVTKIDDVIVVLLGRTSRLIILGISVLIGLAALDLPPEGEKIASQLWFIVVSLQVAMWASRAVVMWMHYRNEKHTEAFNPVIMAMVNWLLKFLIWSVLVLSVLANMGVNITAFIASLGVGGVAVALGLQSMLSDMFASLAIGLDKPFEIGHFITFGDVAGTVQYVGLKTTRIQSLSGQEVICSNADLLKNTINNYKRMTERRIVFNFGIMLDSKPDAVKALPAALKKVVESLEHARFDRAHLKSFERDRIEFELVYFVLSPDFNLYMDVQQQFNFGLMDCLAALDLAFACPVSRVRMQDVSNEVPQQPVSQTAHS